MMYRLLGASGLRVSEICLGTMGFGQEWTWGASREESRKVFDAYAAAGGNFIDTANRYTDGTSERFVGEFVGSERERFVVATKYTLSTRSDDPNAGGNHRKNLVQSLEASLRRLKMEYVDLLYLHAWDFLTPVEEVMRGLDDLVRQGKVLYAGISDTPAWVVSRANTIAELRGWTRFVGLQIEYSLLQRTVERELLPMAAGLDLGVVAWAPLAGGALTGKYLDHGGGPRPGRLGPESIRLNERNTRITREVVAVAREIGCSPSQVAIRWLMQQRQCVIPIVGATREIQIRDCLAAGSILLDDAHMKRLAEVSVVELGFPHDFLSSDPIRGIVFGGTRDRIISHRKHEIPGGRP